MTAAAIFPVPAKTHERFWAILADKLSAAPAPTSRTKFTVLACALVGIIAVADYLASYEVTLRFFYCVPMIIMVATQGRRAAFMMACVCDVSWQIGDFVTGANYSSLIIPVWNLLIALANYSLVIFMMAELIDLKRDLEGRVKSRTAALSAEIQARERLEREVMSVAERERLSIGYDLHDSLSQHFTATAMAAQVLARRLEQDKHPLTSEAYSLVKLVEDGIDQTRRIAKGLLLVAVESDGLANALRDLAGSGAIHAGMRYDLQIRGNVYLNDIMSATHLYRIAEEAVRNAMRHSRAKHLRVGLEGDGASVVLSVKDDGIGISQTASGNRGMGLRIMAHRAAIIGADFSISPSPGGGVHMTCRWRRPGVTA